MRLGRVSANMARQQQALGWLICCQGKLIVPGLSRSFWLARSTFKPKRFYNGRFSPQKMKQRVANVGFKTPSWQQNRMLRRAGCKVFSTQRRSPRICKALHNCSRAAWRKGFLGAYRHGTEACIIISWLFILSWLSCYSPIYRLPF